VNHIVDKKITEFAASGRREESKPLSVYLIVAAMLVYSLLLYGKWEEQLGTAAGLLVAVSTYFFAMYIYYSIARLAYQRYTHSLWGGVIAAVVVAYLLSGASDIWIVLIGWSMLLLAGVLSGRLIRTGYNQGRVYVIGAATVAVFFTLQSLPIWSEFMKTAPQLGEALVEKSEQFLLGLGYSSEMIQKNLNQSRQAFDIMVRLFPAATILATLLQFSIGYLGFTFWVSRSNRSADRITPFDSWKVPFGLAPLLIILILIRILGGELLRMIADNALAVLAVYYCVAGLALVEYYLRKWCLSRLTKTVFYLLLFLTQLAGFFVTALVGFVDSFADWRKVHAREVT